MLKPVRSRLGLLSTGLKTLDTRTARPPAKEVEEQYRTTEHQHWRAEVIRRAGGMCQGPGCYRTGVRLFADHIVELKDGGAATDPANGQALCGSCHTAKTMRARAARMQTPG